MEKGNSPKLLHFQVTDFNVTSAKLPVCHRNKFSCSSEVGPCPSYATERDSHISKRSEGSQLPAAKRYLQTKDLKNENIPYFDRISFSYAAFKLELRAFEG